MSKEIKVECEELFGQIAKATERLKTLRSECSHGLTEEVNYSSRPGSYHRAIVCSDCGEFIRYVPGEVQFTRYVSGKV